MESEKSTDFGPTEESFDFFGESNNEEQQNDTAEGSSPEQNETEESPSQEGEQESEQEEKSDSNTPDENNNLPLNKDRRFQEVLSQKKGLEQQVSEYKEMVEKLVNAQSKPERDEIPQQFLEVFGSGDKDRDQNAWNKYKQLAEFQKQLILDEIKQERETEQKRVQEWESWVDSQVSNFHEIGENITKDEFVSIIQEYEPSKNLQSYDAEKVIQIHKLKREIADLKMAQEKDNQNAKIQAKKQNASKKPSSAISEEKKEYTLEDSSMFKSLFKR